MKWIESYGTGLQRIKESYKHSTEAPFWKVSPNAFVVTLPKQQVAPSLQQNDQVESWLNEKETFTARQLEEYLNRSKGTVRKILESLIKERRIIRVGNGPSTKYVVKN